MVERYNTYAAYLQKTYGSKVYKLPVNLPGTCPNRDGTLGRGGCIFCDEQGAGFQCLPGSYPVIEQISRNRAFFQKRFGARKFIVYFQAFTNTYLPWEDFCRNLQQAASAGPDIVAISISTRPDCLSEQHLAFLARLSGQYGLDINIELGLQTVNYHTLQFVQRGHTLAEYIDAVLRVHKYNFDVCTHLILNLPGDTLLDSIECAKVVSALGVKFVKLHSLYVVEGTVLGELYRSGRVSIISLDEYIERVIAFLEHLHPQAVVQRLVGKGPVEKLLFSNWGISWWRIKQRLEEELERRDTWQGKKCNYLNGAVGKAGENNAGEPAQF
ncbi:MAG: TIGR01212 family radical SAM protein [Desulfurispora sp.]|uniref:TIGR01212 family radical SAM protein n=1 Tax=Desulfurispora sp. TaxID=3014275 RepID=UPI00404A5A64